MSVDWGNFLAGLERHVRSNPFSDGTWTAPAWQAGAPASDADAAAMESRFGVPFPPSYVAFVRTCNGLELASHPIDRFSAAREVDWLRKKQAAWVRTYAWPAEPGMERDPDDDEFYGYSDAARTAYRPSHVRHTIQVSAAGDAAVYLINPQAVWASGEWEAWCLADWNPGVIRHRSFAELMWERYGEQTGMTAEQFGLVQEDGLPTVYRDPPGTPERRVKKPPKPPRSFDRIARDVRFGDLPTMQRAMKEAARLATPEAMQLLSSVANTHPVDFVRWGAHEALQKARRTLKQRSEAQ